VKEIWEILYYLYGTNQNVVLRILMAQDEIIMDGNVKEVEDHQLYDEQEYEIGDPIQGVIHNDAKQAQIEELLENGERNKDSYYSSILQSGKYEVKFMLEFSNNSKLSYF